jgi:hypothetical protein
MISEEPGTVWKVRVSNPDFIGFSLGLKQPGVCMDLSPRLVPMLRMCGAVFVLPLYTFLAWTRIIVQFL